MTTSLTTLNTYFMCLPIICNKIGGVRQPTNGRVVLNSDKNSTASKISLIELALTDWLPVFDDQSSEVGDSGYMPPLAKRIVGSFCSTSDTLCIRITVVGKGRAL